MIQNRESNIERWETVKVLMSETRRTLEGNDLGVSLVVNRPVFKDGGPGWPKVSLVISRNASSYRIPFFKGSPEEVEQIHKLMGEALEKWFSGGAAQEFEQLAAEYHSLRQQKRQEEIDAHTGELERLAQLSAREGSKSGSGLSKFSKVPKRERKRMKYNDRDDDSR